MSFIDLLKVISKHGITLQKDINRRFDIDKSGKSDYFLIRNFEIKLISLFIESLDSKGLYSLIPMISINGKVDEPFITLTNSILITNYSNYVTIHNYIYKNYELAYNQFGFDIDNYYLVFKYKKVWIDFKN